MDKIHFKKNYLCAPGEEWMEGGMKGLQMISLQGNPSQGGLRQGIRFNPVIGCFLRCCNLSSCAILTSYLEIRQCERSRWDREGSPENTSAIREETGLPWAEN